MTKKTPEIIECDEMDIAEMCEAEQMDFYASLLTRIIDLFHEKNKEGTPS